MLRRALSCVVAVYGGCVRTSKSYVEKKRCRLGIAPGPTARPLYTNRRAVDDGAGGGSAAGCSSGCGDARSRCCDVYCRRLLGQAWSARGISCMRPPHMRNTLRMLAPGAQASVTGSVFATFVRCSSASQCEDSSRNSLCSVGFMASSVNALLSAVPSIKHGGTSAISLPAALPGDLQCRHTARRVCG